MPEDEVTGSVPAVDQPIEVPAVDRPIEPPPVPHQPPTFRSFFIGDDGLRAGWSVLLYVLLVMVCGFGLAFANRHLHLIARTQSGENLLSQPRSAFLAEVFQFLIFAVPALVMSLVERRPFGRYGLTASRMLPDFAAGLFWGFTALSALVGALLLAHGIALDGVLLHGATAVSYGLKWSVVFLLVGLGEEFFTRGYLQYTVSRGVAGIVRTMDANNRHSHLIGFWVAAFIFSVLLFAAGHLGNQGENFVGIFQVALVGVVFAFSLYRTGSLWWAIGVHASWDWAQSFFWGTPDSGNMSQGHLLATHPMGSLLLSGGPDGPEGSLLGIPTVLLLGVVIYFTLPRRNYPLTHDQSPPVEADATAVATAHNGDL
jgi:membrane protease YdiL (CAAX protease family)